MFDNEDGAWPELPFAEVSVARRLHRGGEGQYLVNRAAVRRIDLVELISDVGLGDLLTWKGVPRLIAEIGLGHAGLVVSLDGSRLARNNADWHRLLELCGLFGTLLADAERLYERAIRSSRVNEFIHNEAIAYELAARFYAARGFAEFANVKRVLDTFVARPAVARGLDIPKRS